ncbi:helix-turn-helix transcriptional regulator [Phycicoccus endophyticus]|uniref:Helix-turn-helix transcriptional regulator n=1 Tax=Phycicoccus endophyticus TaxID=1690220 RepID=A0A7G9R1L0_9MICO|nr:AraC family transcriptional regulator [Phycicoccus endophyticus]NHI18726.1 helix-turn-helix transcriptional regulator [Phycicoccus endophyticus]QNN49485.1 helix-turn-helix transcriptional regulator [Phycicoccus endophyticus]GGL36969.1 hypothetical protein GCM10012283_19380 [Phycicoccus endophyticus]
MTRGWRAAEECDEFGWNPQGAIDPSLVADTVQHPRYGLGRAWSRSATYTLQGAPKRTYLVFTVEGGFEFGIDRSTVVAEPGSLILLDGQAPVTARTLAHTARYIWYLEPTVLRPRQSRFRFHEPINAEGSALSALTRMTNAMSGSAAPRTESGRRHLGLSLEHLLAAVLDEADSCGSVGDSRHRDGLFMAAQAAIESYYQDPAFSVTRLARELAVSVRTVHETFRRLGTTPRREIERRRLSDAERLRSAEGLTAAQTAERAGFTSAKQLARALARARAAARP